MSATDFQSKDQSADVDATVAAPMTNVAEHGFERRFEDTADDPRYLRTLDIRFTNRRDLIAG